MAQELKSAEPNDAVLSGNDLSDVSGSEIDDGAPAHPRPRRAEPLPLRDLGVPEPAHAHSAATRERRAQYEYGDATLLHQPMRTQEVPLALRRLSGIILRDIRGRFISWAAWMVGQGRDYNRRHKKTRRELEFLCHLADVMERDRVPATGDSYEAVLRRILTLHVAIINNTWAAADSLSIFPTANCVVPAEIAVELSRDMQRRQRLSRAQKDAARSDDDDSDSDFEEEEKTASASAKRKGRGKK